MEAMECCGGRIRNNICMGAVFDRYMNMKEMNMKGTSMKKINMGEQAWNNR